MARFLSAGLALLRHIPRPRYAACDAVVLVALAGLITGCCGEARQTSVASIPREPEQPGQPAPQQKKQGKVLRGEVSYYADYFSGRKTANGERYDPRKLTAANRTLPFGTHVRITRIDTGRSVVVRVNDRGPFGKRRRIFDLSKAAARELDMLHAGRADVEAEILD